MKQANQGTKYEFSLAMPAQTMKKDRKIMFKHLDESNYNLDLNFLSTPPVQQSVEVKD
jgi:hypothetical protein